MATAFAGAGAQIWNTTAFGGGSKTTTLAGATAGDLLVVVVGASGYAGAWTVTDDNSSGTYTDVTGVINENAGTDTMRVFVRNSLVPATASTIITGTASGGGDTGGGFAVYRLTGMSRSGSAAVRQFKVVNNGIMSSTPAATFTSAALTGNSVIGAVIISLNPAGLTPPASPVMVEKHDIGYATPAFGLETCTLDSGFTGTTVTWGSLSGATFGCVIVEMDSSAAPVAAAKQLGLLGVG